MKLQGLGKVTAFTLQQQLKAKPFRVSTIMILSVVFIGMLLLNLVPATLSMSGDTGKSDVDTVTLEKLYFLDETGTLSDPSPLLSAVYPDVAVESVTDRASVEAQVKESEKAEALIVYTQEDGTYHLVMYTPEQDDLVSESDGEAVLSVLAPGLRAMRLIEEGVSADKAADILAGIQTQVLTAGETPKPVQQIIIEMILPMVLAMLLFYIIYFYGYWVATSIVSEKSSRVMELLLTSVKPLAVVAGKCLSMGLLALAQFLSIVLVAVGTYQGSGVLATLMTGGSYTPFNVLAVFHYFTIGNILMIVGIFILGYLLYALLNALAGSMVSRSEDLNISLQPIIFLTMIGFFLAYMAPTMGNPTLTALAALLPLSSPFYLPAAMLMGEIGAGTVALSIGILVATVVLILLFTTRLYETTILHMGNRLKVKDLFAIAKKH